MPSAIGRSNRGVFAQVGRGRHVVRSGRPADGANHARADPGADPRFVSKSSTPTTSISPTCAAKNTPSAPLIVAASGAHNVLMIGTPGSGKTMLTRRMPTILPPLTPSESLETTRIYSAMGRLAPGERCSRLGRSARRITRSATPAWSAAAPSRRRAKSHSPITASSFSTNCPSSIAAASKYCVSRSKKAASRSRGP